jgi:hypothetical protein
MSKTKEPALIGQDPSVKRLSSKFEVPCVKFIVDVGEVAKFDSRPTSLMNKLLTARSKETASGAKILH